MNQKLSAISTSACSDLSAFISEKESEILEAWNQAEQEAQDQETKPKFKLAFSVTLDLDADRMETALSWSVRHKVTLDRQIPDPSQSDLPLEDETTVTLSTDGVEPVTMTAAQFNKAARKLSGKA